MVPQEDTGFSPSRPRSKDDLASAYSARNPFQSTIRTVTPESIPEGRPLGSDEGFAPSSPPTSPRGSTRESPGHISRAYRLRSGSNNERGQGNILRDQQTRPRTRTLEERPHRDASPSSLFIKSRHRIGSVHSASAAAYNGIEDAVTSIGHPSITPAHDLPIRPSDPRPAESARNRLAKQFSRESDPASVLPSSSPAALPHDPHPELGELPMPDTNKMIKLMQSVRGRMEGPLAFRRGENTPWAASYCNINDESGSLVYETKSSETFYRTLIPDLRGCNITQSWDAESQMLYIDVRPQNSKLKVHLRPHTQDEFDSWFAALMCWHPMRPKGVANRMAKPQASGLPERRLQDTRRHSEVSLLKEAPIIKVGKMVFWDTNVSYSYAGTPKTAKPATPRMQSFASRRWRRVSCTLRENGELKLYTEQDVQLVTCVQLSQLSRCAVQRLDPSVLDNEFCIAIFPQYAASPLFSNLIQPIFVSVETRVLYEVWLVLLRAFTIPQLYGPKQPLTAEEIRNSRETGSLLPSTTDMFRMERSLSVRVTEARLVQPQSPTTTITPAVSRHPQGGDNGGGFYAEVMLEGETRAKTMVKGDTMNPFWREEFDFQDLPAVISVATIILKKRPPGPPHNERSLRDQSKKMYDSLQTSDGGGASGAISFDQTYGKVDIYLDDLESGKELEKWWPVHNIYGQHVGEVFVRVASEENIILMARDYQPMSEILHKFSNGITLQLAQAVPQELRRLSECLLNIFQVSGTASDWIMSLVEEEIDGTLKEPQSGRLRLSRRVGSNDSSEGTMFGPPVDRELLVRDMNKNATLEANLLFRGNTILTKSLDLHMKRLGKEYLEDTLGDKLKEIADRDPDCEVDPNRISNANELDRNWRKLIRLTEECWNSIVKSAPRCPQELRYIFRHIRACAEDRYGDFLRSVSYSSVSGFLFLRFFCPAILNPKLFGLVKDHPKQNARRAFTLIAKAIQGLANMSNFGAKEQWMEPMNAFLTSHRQDFKNFLDNICSINPGSASQTPMPPSYSTPLAILNRLPSTSKEGFPSLPYLIDHARNHAALVTLWLGHAKEVNILEAEGDMKRFHQLCLALRQRTEDCLARAERAERPTSVLDYKWDALVEELESQRFQSNTPDSPSDNSRPGLSLEMPPFESSRTPRAKQPIPQSPNSVATSPYPPSENVDEAPMEADTPPRSAGADQFGTSSGGESSGKEGFSKMYRYGYSHASGVQSAREAAAKQKDRERRAREKEERRAYAARQPPVDWNAATPASSVSSQTPSIGRGSGFNRADLNNYVTERSFSTSSVPPERMDRYDSNGTSASGSMRDRARERQRFDASDRQAFTPSKSTTTERPQSSDSRSGKLTGREVRQQRWQEQQLEHIGRMVRDRDNSGTVSRPEVVTPNRPRDTSVSQTDASSATAQLRSRPNSRPGTQPGSSASSDNEGTTALPRIKGDRDRERERDREKNGGHILERVGLMSFKKRKG
jgi:GTPase-activator protein for Ras-like GTPase/C2 domain